MTAEDPVTLSMAAVAGSSALSAGGSVIGGMNQEAAANISAQQSRQQAGLALKQSAIEISSNDYNTGKVISQGVANAGAAGVTQDTATPVISEDYSEAKMKDTYSRYTGQLAATNDLYQADVDRYQGKQAFIKGIFGGVQNVLGGAAGEGGLAMANGGWPNLGIGSGSSPTP